MKKKSAAICEGSFYFIFWLEFSAICFFNIAILAEKIGNLPILQIYISLKLCIKSSVFLFGIHYFCARWSKAGCWHAVQASISLMIP